MSKLPGPEMTGQLIEFPSKKVLSYISIHGLPGGPLESGWRVTHHYKDGGEKDCEFLFADARGNDTAHSQANDGQRAMTEIQANDQSWRPRPM